MRTGSRFAAFAVLFLSSSVNLAAPAMAAPSRPQGPCDIYAKAGTPCVTAHSTVRALLAAYDGPLYQVKRQPDGKLLDIGIVRPSGIDAGGYADAAAQDRFCANALCVINRIYDQSGKGNDLHQAPPGPLYPGPAKGAFDAQPIADMAPITIAGGHKAYGVFIMPGMGFRNNNARGLPINDEPAGIHVVVDGTHYSNGCCFNYGNASTNGLAVGTGTMESVYFGTSSGWGSGAGKGPWVMSDMEAGLFSGYNARVNEADPAIDHRFVTGMMGGGGRNFWNLRGGNAQQGPVSTFYSGVRPGSRENSNYYPMHKKGAIQMGNGGDNGNGSAGTFYEGVMVSGHPSEATTDAIQANIVAAKYDVEQLRLSRVTGATPGSVKELTITFTNTMDKPVTGLSLALASPHGWSAAAVTPVHFASAAPGAKVSATFQLTSPLAASAGFLTARATWRGGAATIQQRVRNAAPVKINEVRFATGGNATDQFAELYNASSATVDISGWKLVNTQTFFAPVPLATISANTKLASKSFYLLGLAGSGLAAPATAGASNLNLRSVSGFAAGQSLNIEGEDRTIRNVGTPATVPTTIFILVSTGPTLTVPAGATNLPVMNATGFTAGEKIGIDAGGRYEIVTVTAVGKAGIQTTLTIASKAGDSVIKVANAASITVGDRLTVGTGQRMEKVTVAAIGTAGTDGTDVTLSAPLTIGNIVGVDVAGPGTGISFRPATRFAHTSGDAVQALGSGVTLDRPLGRTHGTGAPVLNPAVHTDGYQGPAPNQWFGGNLSIRGGSIALTDPSGQVVADALVYGSQQSNSSANGPVTSPELATLEGDQGGGGCIAVIPGAGSGPSAAATAVAAAAPGAPNRSVGRFPDGRDTDSLCNDFVVQAATTLPEGAAAGATTIEVASVADFVAGQSVMIGSGANMESHTIAAVGTAGATHSSAAAEAGATALSIAAGAGFTPGQTITIGNGADREIAVVAAASGGRGGARLTITAPLKMPHAAGVQISGSGITLAGALATTHASGDVVTTDLPTPGAANKYSGASARR
jgi:non-reducing end alpha-L-arabinofuranosidase